MKNRNHFFNVYCQADFLSGIHFPRYEKILRQYGGLIATSPKDVLLTLSFENEFLAESEYAISFKRKESKKTCSEYIGILDEGDCAGFEKIIQTLSKAIFLDYALFCYKQAKKIISMNLKKRTIHLNDNNELALQFCLKMIGSGQKKIDACEFLLKSFPQCQIIEKDLFVPNKAGQLFPLILDFSKGEVLWISYQDIGLFEFLIALQSLGGLYQRPLSEYNEWTDLSELKRYRFPMALISKSGEIIYHNEKFIDLGLTPSECLEKENHTYYQFEDKVFKFQREDLETEGPEYILVYFTEVERPGEEKHKDLGIISGSVAHEMNNPIAAILATLEILELEEGLTREEVETIGEMKLSAGRCKDLIELFLGFSRTMVRNNALGNMKRSFEQAVRIIRFRMMEEGANFKILGFFSRDKFALQKNFPMMSMLFYLILNELINEIKHSGLVKGQRGENSEHLFSAYEFKEEVFLTCSGIEEKKLVKKISDVKLVTYLLDMLEMNICYRINEGAVIHVR